MQKPRRGVSAVLSRHPAACTIVARNYLPHARVLAESYLRHHPGAHFYLLVVDRLPEGEQTGPSIELIQPEELELSYFFEMCFKYDVTELSTAVKPTLLALLFEKYGENEVVYFDPDILIARPLTELKKMLKQTSIVLIPHLLEPIPLDGKRPNETDILIAGAYNLGFIGLRKTPQTRAFLQWWEQRLRDHCVVDTARGLMTDQKWMDLTPGLFPETQILYDQTYNVAYWNIHTRPISSNRNGFLVNGKPLAFYHFSGFKPQEPRSLSKHQDRTQIIDGTPFAKLIDLYAELLLTHGYESASKWQYGYSVFDNGIGVNRILRQLYLKLDKSGRARVGDPFKANGPVSFLRWATTATAKGELSPFLDAVYRMRFDVISAFPDIRGRDFELFLFWAKETGTREMGFAAELAELAEPATDVVVTNSTALHGLDGINVCGYLRNESGLGGAARGYIRAIENLGLNVALKDISHSSLNRSEDSTLAAMHDDHPHAVNLVCVNPEQHFQAMPHIGEAFFKDRYNIGVWAWELPRFPDKWRDRFQYYDEIWVGSSFIADALAPSSPVPIIPIPPVLTAAKRSSRPAGRKLLKAGQKDFVFFFAFDFHSYFERKNPLAVIRAFKTAFKRPTSVKLVIKCVNEQFKPDQFAALIAEARGFPISILPGYVSDEQMREMIEGCDCYVSLHRAEGTGLTIADAMAIGKPVIATSWSGNTDFMHVSNSFPVRYRLEQLTQNIGPYRAGETWAEPSIEHAAEAMRFVKENPAAAAQRGRAARAEIEAHYSADAVSQLIHHRLSVISSRRQFSDLRDAMRNGDVKPKHVTYEDLILRVQDAIGLCVPADAKVSVISRGDDRLLKLQGRATCHFPQNADGAYAGYHPADSAAAIAHLESQRAGGTQFLVLPNTAFWWLEHYAEFKKHLDTTCRLVGKDDACLVFDLRSAVPILAPVLAVNGSSLTPAVPEYAAGRFSSIEATMASLEARLMDVQESLRAHAIRSATEAETIELRQQSMLERIEAYRASLSAVAIESTRDQARVNELATLVEAHAQRVATQDSRLSELVKNTAARVSEANAHAAMLRNRVATTLPTATDSFGMPLIKPLMDPANVTSKPARSAETPVESGPHD